MITLITHVISDFAEGIELQILGHALTFSFKPITESDMIRHIGLADKGVNHRRAKPEEFEAAVQATAEDVSQGLKILDRWHERALGSGMLRAQLANLIARLVLTLADEVLSGARMDLWAAPELEVLKSLLVWSIDRRLHHRYHETLIRMTKIKEC
jgi:hypothetical protein